MRTKNTQKHTHIIFFFTYIIETGNQGRALLIFQQSPDLQMPSYTVMGAGCTVGNAYRPTVRTYGCRVRLRSHFRGSHFTQNHNHNHNSRYHMIYDTIHKYLGVVMCDYNFYFIFCCLLLCCFCVAPPFKTKTFPCGCREIRTLSTAPTQNPATVMARRQT